MDKIQEKKETIAEFIRLVVLQAEQLDCCLLLLVMMANSNNGKKVDVEKVVEMVKKRIQSDAFIEENLAPFDEIFSHYEIRLLINFYKEIRSLLGFYRSKTVKKFLKNWSKLFHPIYQAYRLAVKEALEQEPADLCPAMGLQDNSDCRISG